MSYHPFREMCEFCDGIGTVAAPDSVIKHTCMHCLGKGYHESGSFEAFHRGAHCEEHPEGSVSCHDCAMNCGWYWWPCSPGCLPEGEPTGPFETEEEALADARD